MAPKLLLLLLILHLTSAFSYELKQSFASGGPTQLFVIVSDDGQDMILGHNNDSISIYYFLNGLYYFSQIITTNNTLVDGILSESKQVFLVLTNSSIERYHYDITLQEYTLFSSCILNNIN